jgi:hypothetical protein
VHGECNDKDADELYANFEAESAALAIEFALRAPRVTVSEKIRERVRVYAGKYDAIAPPRIVRDTTTGEVSGLIKAVVGCGHMLPICEKIFPEILLDIKQFFGV